MYSVHQRLISLVVFAFVLGNGAGQVPVPRSEIAENSSCNDFAWLLVPVRYASALDQLGRFAFVLGNGAGQVPVPRSETAERSLCNDFTWSLMHVRFSSALDQIGRFCLAPASE